MSLNDKVKEMDWVDISFLKLSVIAFTLFVISFLADYITNISQLRWLWFILAIIFGAKPAYKLWFKKKPQVKIIPKVDNKKGAIELSIGTIVIIVIAITMLVFGIVFVRNIMCSAINLTDELGKNAESEINNLFGSVGGEIQCIGSGGDAITLVPGRINIIYCGIRAKETAEYEIRVREIRGEDLSSSTIENWIVADDDTWRGTVAPGDESSKKVLRLRIPENAPEKSLVITIEAKRDSEVIKSQELDFEISRAGVIRSTIC